MHIAMKFKNNYNVFHLTS